MCVYSKCNFTSSRDLMIERTCEKVVQILDVNVLQLLHHCCQVSHVGTEQSQWREIFSVMVLRHLGLLTLEFRMTSSAVST